MSSGKANVRETGAPHTPLDRAFAARLTLLATILKPSTVGGYRGTARLFLDFMRSHFASVHRPSQLRRDPHVLGWLEHLHGSRSAKDQPLNDDVRSAHLLRLRTLLELMDDLDRPPKPNLVRASDIPKRRFSLPRPLTPEDDDRLRRYWESCTGILDTALYLMRRTGIRIGECVDLSSDCLRHLGDNAWSLHVPHGKPRSERWVPVEDRTRELIERLTFLRSLPPGADDRYLLPRPDGRNALMKSLRDQLRQSAASAGVSARLVPHQLRHTYATTLLRAGISFPALMRLMGHHNANMTLIYLQVTQQDLQNEYHSAIERPRYLAPIPTVPISSDSDPTPASTLDALQLAVRLIDTQLRNSPSLKDLSLLRRRLARAIPILKKLLLPDK